jgi:hypothetical protein
MEAFISLTQLQAVVGWAILFIGIWVSLVDTMRISNQIHTRFAIWILKFMIWILNIMLFYFALFVVFLLSAALFQKVSVIYDILFWILTAIVTPINYITCIVGRSCQFNF